MPNFTTMTPFQAFLAGLSYLGVTIAGVLAVAYAVFRFLAKGWIQTQFAKELEAFKAKNELELERAKGDYQHQTERLRAEIGRLADRASLFHQREYDVLPEAWGLLNKAYGATNRAVSFFQQIADVGRMRPEQLEEFLAGVDISETEKQELRDAKDKNATFSVIHDRMQLRLADQACIEFNNYVIVNGIFIEDSIVAKFDEAARLLRRAVTSKHLYREDRERDLWQEAADNVEKVGALVAEIKADVKRRLWQTQMPATGEKEA